MTGTVPSIPLITASILSKKLAEGIQALVMDVKFGCAAFMQTETEARALADSIVSLAEACGVRTEALLTDMNTPLGRAVGNWLEVKEAVDCLEGRGPDDLKALVIECAARLLLLTARAPDMAAARKTAAGCLASGAPRRKWDELISAQGADLGAFRNQLAIDHVAPVVAELTSPRGGFISRCDARIIGEVVRDLGGGRLTQETVLNPAVGIDRLAKPGERIKAGDVLCRIHAAIESDADAARARLISAFALTDSKPAANR